MSEPTRRPSYTSMILDSVTRLVTSMDKIDLKLDNLDAKVEAQNLSTVKSLENHELRIKWLEAWHKTAVVNIWKAIGALIGVGTIVVAIVTLALRH